MPPIYFTKAHLLAVAKRALGRYAEDLEAAGRVGWAVIRAQAAMFERVSLAIGRFEEQSFVETSTGPALATTTLTWKRANVAAGAFTIKAGTLVRNKAGAVFRQTADLPFGGGDLGPLTAPAVAVGYGEEWNLLGRYTSPRGEILPGEIDTIDMLLLDPPFVERSLTVENISDITNGQLGILHVHGIDVDLPPVRGETDASYQGRILDIAKAVDPLDVRHRLRQFFEAICYAESDWYIVETFAHAFTSFYDAPEAVYPLYPDYNPTLGVYDDPRPTSPIRGRWLDMANAEGAGILEFRDLPAVEETGMVFDDPALTQAELATTLGTRATSAFDLTDDVVTCRHSCYDGFDLEREAILKKLSDLLESITLHGVNTTLVAQGE